MTDRLKLSVSLKHDGRDGTDRTAKQTGHGRRPVCPVGDRTAKTDGTAVVEAKSDTNRNLTVVTHVVPLHVWMTSCDVKVSALRLILAANL